MWTGMCISACIYSASKHDTQWTGYAIILVKLEKVNWNKAVVATRHILTKLHTE